MAWDGEPFVPCALAGPSARGTAELVNSFLTPACVSPLTSEIWERREKGRDIEASAELETLPAQEDLKLLR